MTVCADSFADLFGSSRGLGAEVTEAREDLETLALAFERCPAEGPTVQVALSIPTPTHCGVSVVYADGHPLAQVTYRADHGPAALYLVRDPAAGDPRAERVHEELRTMAAAKRLHVGWTDAATANAYLSSVAGLGQPLSMAS